jgi:PAS domain S-box-containing protein
VTLARNIDRLIELDELESAKLHDRAAFMSLTAAVIEALPDALVVADIDGKIVLFNEKAEFMFGYHRSEMIGHPVEALMPMATRGLHARHRDNYNRFDVSPHARKMGLGAQLTGIRSDGHEFLADITLARMTVPKGIFNLAMIRYAQPEQQRPTVPDNAPSTDQQNAEPDAGH